MSWGGPVIVIRFYDVIFSFIVATLYILLSQWYPLHWDKKGKCYFCTFTVRTLGFNVHLVIAGYIDGSLRERRDIAAFRTNTLAIFIIMSECTLIVFDSLDLYMETRPMQSCVLLEIRLMIVYVFSFL